MAWTVLSRLWICYSGWLLSHSLIWPLLTLLSYPWPMSKNEGHENCRMKKVTPMMVHCLLSEEVLFFFSLSLSLSKERADVILPHNNWSKDQEWQFTFYHWLNMSSQQYLLFLLGGVVFDVTSYRMPSWFLVFHVLHIWDALVSCHGLQYFNFLRNPWSPDGSFMIQTMAISSPIPVFEG